MVEIASLLAAAHDEFAEHGYAKAGMAEIARRAGIAVGSVYNSFPSKKELFVEVYLAENQASKEAIIATIDWSQPREALLAFFAANLAALRSNRILAEWGSPSIGAYVRQRAGECHLLHGFFADRLAQWREAGLIADGASNELINNLFDAAALIDCAGTISVETQLFLIEAILDRLFPATQGTPSTG